MFGRVIDFNVFRSRKTNPKVNVAIDRSAGPPVVAALPIVNEPVSSQNAINGWILSPTLDLLFACGGLVWIVYAFIMAGVTPAATASGFAAVAIWWLAKLGTIVFNWGHQPATLWRVYCSPRTRKSVGRLVAFWGVVAVGLAIPSLLVPGFVNVFMKLIVFWQIQHVFAQAYGVALIYCYKRKYKMSEFEKQTLFRLMNLGVLFIVLRCLVVVEASPAIINGVSVPFWGPLPGWILTLGLFAFASYVSLFAYNIIRRFMREKEMFPWPALLNLVSCIVLFLPLNIGAASIDIFSIFVIGFYHGSQYLVVTSAYFLKEHGLPEGLPSNKISTLLWTPHARKYFATIILVGVLLADSIPRLLSYWFGFSPALTFGTIFCVLNFHHYLTDSFIWRLKDPEVRRLLII